MAKKKIVIPPYLKKILEKYPKLKSGRKNYLEQHKRILKNIFIVKEYYKNKKNNNSE